jgi:hypothetical protein
MAQPRFLFVAGVELVRSGWVQGPSQRGLLGEGGPDGSWVAWRLAGGNNRELGRSAAVFADIAGCRQAAAALRWEIDETTRVVAANDPTGLWGWRLELAGLPVAAAGRLYLRQRECLYNLAQFVAAVPAARLSGHVVYLARDRSDPGLPRPRDGHLDDPARCPAGWPTAGIL